MTWSIIYLVSVLTAQYTAEWFVPVFGSLAIGTLTFGVTFTARDKVHYLGRKSVYTMILVSILASVALSFLGDVSARIILASSIAIAISETMDTEVYQKLIKRHWIIRVLSSNAISIPLDTILFATIAFSGVFPILPIIQADIIVKFIISIIVGLLLIKSKNIQEV